MKGYKIIPFLDFRYAINKHGDILTLFGSHGLLDGPTKLKPKIADDGYAKVTFTLDNGKKLKTSQHRVMAAMFLGLDFSNKKLVVNHKNCIKSDNRLSNLEVVTPKQNMQHASKNGLFNKGKKMKFSQEEKENLMKLIDLEKAKELGIVK